MLENTITVVVVSGQRLWDGGVEVNLEVRLRRVHSRTLHVGQRHNIVADLLHLRPVDGTRHYCR